MHDKEQTRKIIIPNYQVSERPFTWTKDTCSWWKNMNFLEELVIHKEEIQECWCTWYEIPVHNKESKENVITLGMPKVIFVFWLCLCVIMLKYLNKYEIGDTWLCGKATCLYVVKKGKIILSYLLINIWLSLEGMHAHVLSMCLNFG